METQAQYDNQPSILILAKSFISKLIERAVPTEVNRHVHNNKLGEPLQPAYCPLHSTETALLRVKNEFYAALMTTKQ